MLDLKAIRRDPDPVRAALARRRDGSDARLDRALELDARRLELLPEVEALRARQNEASLETAVASLPNPPDPSAADEGTTVREVGDASKTGADHLEVGDGMIDM